MRLRLYPFLILILLCLSGTVLESRADDDIPDLETVKTQQKAAYRAINRVNPVSSDFQKPAIQNTSGDFTASLPPGLVGAGIITQINAVLSNPIVQKFLQLLSNPTSMGFVNRIERNPNLQMVLYCQIGWLVFFMFFKAWRMSRLSSENWFALVWLKLWSFALYIVMAAFVIPWQLLGDPYYQLVTNMFQTILSLKIY